MGISLPYWLFILLCIFATVGIVDRVFAPSVRWFLRRRVNRAIDQLNTKLATRIQPFKLTRKQTLVDQLMYDPQVIKAAEKIAEEDGTPIAVVMEKAERYAREIVPSFSPLTYFGIGTRLSKLASHFVYRVRLGYLDDENLSKIDPDASVIFVMNHRSNMDYILVTHLASARTTLSYAVGEWANIWGLRNVIRAMGAYFIRRKSNNELYRKVLARYVAMATSEGVPQAVFPEGGLSRDGNLAPAKLGLFSYMLSDYNSNNGRDIVFIPVGINYDRVMEDRILTRKLEQDYSGRDFSVNVSRSLSFIGNLIWRRLSGKLYRYGYACVSFGKPVSIKDYLSQKRVIYENLNEEKRFKLIAKLGDELLEKVGEVVPVLPVALLATVFANSSKKSLTDSELKSQMFKLVSDFEKRGVHVHIPRDDLDYALNAGKRMLLMRRIIKEEDGAYSANPEEKILLEYYANSIAHLLK